MTSRANPQLADDLRRYGAEDVQKCYHCGNCTATCELSQEPFLLPRRSMRALQLGLDRRLRSSLEPWLCYYCGDCSEQCPRGADPGETMMSLRRWLTGQYDFTGIAKLFYRSPTAEVLAMIAVAVATGAGFVAYALLRGGSLSVYDGPGAFLPEPAVHAFDWGMAAVLVLLLAINSARMWYFTMRSEDAPRVPAASYLRHLVALPFHFLTQRRYAQCRRRRPWAVHLVLVLSYVTMLVLIVFFLPEMQHGPEVRWSVHAFGYAAAVGLLVSSVLALHGRLTKREPHHRHSHASDWIFIGLLLFLTVSGIAQHVLHRAEVPVAANVAYLIHLMAVASFEICQVPFGKWSHLAYRPLAIYFAKLQRSAVASAAEAAQPSLRAA